MKLALLSFIVELIHTLTKLSTNVCAAGKACHSLYMVMMNWKLISNCSL